ncbi:MAG: hypothetical protein WC848_00980 [Parcubacteria group bacterium]|jgi:hypothetical protein
MEENKIRSLNEFVEKIDQMKKQDKMDLSSDQDLSIAIMNLVSIEEHFFFTGAKLQKPEYFDLLQEARKMRGELLREIVKDPQGEEWCISKHLLAASMRLMEVGTKQQGMGRKEKAQDLFQKAYDLYSLFWGINMKVINTGDIKKIDDEALNRHDDKKNKSAEIPQAQINNSSVAGSAKTASVTERSGFMGKLGELVRKAIDCCIE